MNDFWLTFVPLFIAVDAIGVLPIYLSITNETEPAAKHPIVIQSVITAAAVALIFLFFGPPLLLLLGISVADFMIAGGILLFVIALSDLITGEKRQRTFDPTALGAVPIGVPLITGPGVLTTSILVANAHGTWITSLSLLLNIAIAGVIFWFGDPLANFLGNAGGTTISQIASLLLASIAVMLVRKGIIAIVTGSY